MTKIPDLYKPTFNLPNLGFLSGVDIPVVANDDGIYNLFKNVTNVGVAQIGVAGNNIGGARNAWLSSGQAGGNAEYYGSNMKAKLGYAVVPDIKYCIKY